jgi:plasmid stabilization system protein ParE
MTASKRYRIEWRPLARHDLLFIVRHIAQDNPPRARSFGEELRKRTGALSQLPELGRAGRLPGVRDLVVHSKHIVFYRILDVAKVVEILRVKHAAQRFP